MLISYSKLPAVRWYQSFTAILAVVALCFDSAAAAENQACQLRAAPLQKTLDSVRTTYFNNLTAEPFGVAFALHKDIAFFMNASSAYAILGVLNVTKSTPSLIHDVLPIKPKAVAQDIGQPTLTHNGRYILVPIYNTVYVYDVEKAINGTSGALVGSLVGSAGKSAIQVTIAPDDEWAFLSMEYGNGTSGIGNIDVFHLYNPLANGTISADYTGAIAFDYAVVGSSLSKDGRFLFVTSEVVNPADIEMINTAIYHNVSAGEGSLSILDVEILKTDPGKSLIAAVPSGCDPVKCLVSPDDKWFGSQQEKVTGYSPSMLKKSFQITLRTL